MDLSNLAIDDSVEVQTNDVPVTSGSRIQDTGIYKAKIELAYLTESGGGATGLVLHLKEQPFGNFTHKETLWVTSGNAKGKRNYYVTPEGAKRLLPGMQMAEDLCQLLVGKSLADVTVEKKMVKLWSYDAQEEVPTEVPVLMDLIGKDVQMALQKVVENKNAKTDNGWRPTNEKRESNQVDKFFDEEGLTLAEKKTGSDPKYAKQWNDKFAGKVKDRFKAVDEPAKVPGASPMTPAASTGSLFD